MAKRKFLILTSHTAQTSTWEQREADIKKFCSGLEDRLENIEALYSTYDDLEYTVRDGKTAIFDLQNKLDLRDYDLVHFKNWRYEVQDASLIAMYLDWHGVTYFNSEVKTGFLTSKICQMAILGRNKLPVPDTYFGRQRRLKELFKNGQLPAGLKFPLVMKANDGTKGLDNFLLKDFHEGLKILASYKDAYTQFILQNFLPNDGDYRLLFTGTDHPPLIFKRTAKAGSHLNNTSQGGSGEFIDLKDFPAEHLRIGQKAAQALKREVAGVDLLIDSSSQKPYILEVNVTPALATGFGTDEKLDNFSHFLENILEVQEEE